MSCGCDNNSYQITPQESVASQLDNLLLALYGTIDKTIVDGRATYSTPCSPNDSIPCFPRLSGEGSECYLLRLFADYFTPFIGVHNQTLAYCKGNIVTSGSGIYLALQNVPENTLISNTSYWSLVLQGPAGPAGPTGPAGSGSAINYSVRTETGNYTATTSDAVILCNPSATQTITLPLANALSGKWFKIKNLTGSFAVNIVRAGSNTIEGAIGGETSLALTYKGEGVTLVSDGTSKWAVF